MHVMYFSSVWTPNRRRVPHPYPIALHWTAETRKPREMGVKRDDTKGYATKGSVKVISQMLRWVPSPYLLRSCSGRSKRKRYRLGTHLSMCDGVMVIGRKTKKEEKKELAGSLAEKKLLTEDALEGMVNGRRVRGRRRYQMIDDIKIIWIICRDNELSNINDTREEIKRRINMGNACYYSVEKLLSSSLLSKNLKVRIYKTVILPVLLYGCETWTLTLREEHRFRVFENKVLRKIFGAKRDEVTGEWRKLHNTELHALYSSPDIIRNIKSRRLRWAGHVARMGESRNAYRVLVGRPEGKRPLGRPRRRWEDNIKMDLRGMMIETGLILHRIGTAGGLM
ncbi:hypothetical protein ANN_14291 [Periplaneta americana]|uniref:Endonuclease-reverse transcriptase n=1 Tax=Periplaneta americana TaxID=6978 RepID=A0ABQ8SWZ5_PERAM|nr:hypothetical protein ANN_14291 [Periplaneta americana]